MRRDRCCMLVIAACAFGAGSLLVLFAAYKWAFIICVLLLLAICRQLARF